MSDFCRATVDTRQHLPYLALELFTRNFCDCGAAATCRQLEIPFPVAATSERQQSMWHRHWLYASQWADTGHLLHVESVANVYLEVLADHLPESFDMCSGKILQQDGAPAHTTKSVTQWLRDYEVPFIDNWPGNSSDINMCVCVCVTKYMNFINSDILCSNVQYILECL